MAQFLPALCLGIALWLGGKVGLNIANYSFSVISGFYAAVIAIVFYLVIGGYYTIYLAYQTLPRDLRAVKRYIKVRILVGLAQFRNESVPKLFYKNVSKNPNKVALIFENEKWTFAKIDEYSNRVANYLLSKGLKRHESVALFMENRPEYVATWLGCSKIGVVTALINFNLRNVPLVHSVTIVDSRVIICGAELQDAILEVSSDLKNIPILVSGLKNSALKRKDWDDFDEGLSISPPIPLADIEKGNFTDSLVYIYTSGTTGLPKAAIIKHSRYILFAAGVYAMTNLGEDDIIYNPLPLYHTAGGAIGIGLVVIFNCTSVIRKKFSVSKFWSEAKKHNCTIAQYVGELCRYLLNSPPRPEDTQHKVRLMFGNGVRPQIWEEFTARFNMPCIAEFYGSTEGITNAREPGEFLAKIQNNVLGRFHGYADKKATEKKIARDVFRKGDFAFLSGDILLMDEFGYLYFMDRVGDTFRWRGENVSTTEVEGLVSQVVGHKDAVVFGVEVPHTEGRAGMAVIVDPKGDIDTKTLYMELQKNLPPYARPLFIRIAREIDSTGTFKLKKMNLQHEGFDIHKIKDKLYFLDAKLGAYLPLSPELYDKVISGKVGL